MQQKGYRRLIVYKRMMEYVLLTYKMTSNFPDDEKYNLTAQLRRAVVSVISNFTEGYLKKSPKEKDLYLEQSATSLHETDTQFEISMHLLYISRQQFSEISEKENEISYLLHRYRQKVTN